MQGTAAVSCPQCGNEFLVPGHAVETLCPQCDEHIVWRRCLTTGEAFPVLTRWKTWTHPGCSLVHPVRIVLPVTAPQRTEPERCETAGGETVAPMTLLGKAVWRDVDVAGELYLGPAEVGVLSDGGQAVSIAALSDIRSVAITQRHGHYEARHRRTRRRQSRHRQTQRRQEDVGCRIVLRLPETSAQIDAAITADALRRALRSRVPIG